MSRQAEAKSEGAMQTRFTQQAKNLSGQSWKQKKQPTVMCVPLGLGWVWPAIRFTSSGASMSPCNVVIHIWITSLVHYPIAVDALWLEIQHVKNRDPIDPIFHYEM